MSNTLTAAASSLHVSFLELEITDESLQDMANWLSDYGLILDPKDISCRCAKCAPHLAPERSNGRA